MPNLSVLIELAEKLEEEIQTIEVGEREESCDTQKGVEVTTKTLPQTATARKNNVHSFVVKDQDRWKYITLKEIVALTSGK
jgi:3-dehydroquinate synthase class II